MSTDLPSEGYNKSDIARECDISANGVRRNIDVFVEFGLIEETTSDDARVVRYTNRRKSELYAALRYANDLMAEQYESQ
jgi:DNA-binding MarR family transcriptional regulator